MERTARVEESPKSLFTRWLGGDQSAATQLFAMYSRKLTALANRRLSNCLRARIDGEDVVQSVFRTFFRRAREGQFQFTDSQQLWPLLVKITVVKACGKARHCTAGARDVRRDASHDWPAALMESLSREPSPDQAAILVDLIDRLLEGLPPLSADILGQLLAGCRKTEIAENLGISRQTVYRHLDLFQQQLRELLVVDS